MECETTSALRSALPFRPWWRSPQEPVTSIQTQARGAMELAADIVAATDLACGITSDHICANGIPL